MFISRPSLWTNLDCKDEDQAHVYLKRSKSLPVNLSLYTDDRLPPYHPFFNIIPHAIGRLGSLFIGAKPEYLQDITNHLSRPAPLLKKLSIRGGYDHEPHRNPVLTRALFNGDLSSLRELGLDSVRTELPWRNMANLTSFTLCHTSPGGATVRQFLEFFESAHRLREVVLYSAAPTSGAQNGWLVSLACLKRFDITGGGSASSLLDHVLIPVGTRMTINVDLPNPPTKDHPLKFLNNLRNLPNFTAIELWGGSALHSYMYFSGPNGQIRMYPNGGTCQMLESLNHFDTSKTESLRITGTHLFNDHLHRALLPMKRLRALTLYRFESSHIFIHALHPSMSPSEVVVCPKLEELHLELRQENLDLKDVIGMATARASRGAKLKSVTILRGNYVRADVLELKKHVFHVECGPESNGVDDDGDDIDEGD